MKPLDGPQSYADSGCMIEEPDTDLLEIGTILAAGLQRLFERKSSQISQRAAETLLDCKAPSGGHVRPANQDILR